MAITYISTSEFIVGANHPRFSDIKNRGGLYIENQIDAEHGIYYGVHDGRNTALLFETGSYTGNGTSYEVSLSNSNFWPEYIEVWYSHAVDEPIVGAGSSVGYTWTATGTVASCFITRAVGSFTVGTATNTNRNGSTFYWFVIGYDITTTMSPTGGSDPTYVQHGDALLGDAGAGTSNANKVENYIEEAYLQEHNDDGTHSVTVFDHRFDGWGAYTGTGADDRDIALTTLDDLNIKYLFIHRTAGAFCGLLRTEDVAGDATKENDVAALQANQIQSVGTGTLQVGDDAKVNAAATYYQYFAIGD